MNGLWLSVLLGLMTSALAFGQAKEENKILFLHLRMKDGVITLAKSITVPGTLKPQRRLEKPGAFQFELETAAGVSLWNGAMDDPSIRRYEYEDPENPGAIKTKMVQLAEVEFVVRVPVLKDARQFSLYRTETSTAKGGAPPAGAQARPARTLLTRIQLPADDTR